MVRLIVHGGAWNIPEEYHPAHVQGVRRAIETVYPRLKEGQSALDAVEAAVAMLEADPTFDAGRGAFLNERGEIELDALIMDGASLDFGAVAAVQNLLHPVSLARRIMEESEHCFLVGAGAQAFARSLGIPELKPEELLTERELEFYRAVRDDPHFKPHHPFQDGPRGTVGAAALDCAGNIAAATSTGGSPRKLPGRVGDTPVVGAGGYADNRLGGVSATGWGESIMKVLLSKTVCDLFHTHTAGEAARRGISILATRVQGMGGVVGIHKNGDYAVAHNTPKMAFAYAGEDGSIVAGIESRLRI